MRVVRRLIRYCLTDDPHVAAIIGGIVTLPVLLALVEMFGAPDYLLGNNGIMIALIVSWIAYIIVYKLH